MKENGLALIALSILLCIAFPDVVFRGRTLLTSPYAGSVMGSEPPYGYPESRPAFNMYLLDPGASAWQYEPLTSKASRLYLSGRLPLWNASQGFGAPLAANMQSSVYYPPSLPLLLAPSSLMWNVYLLARLLLAGLFTFLFVRSAGVGCLGAFGASTAFMLSGYLLLWVNNSWLNVDVLVPALLYGVEKALRGLGRGSVLFLAAVVSATILGGMPESTFVVLLLALSYTVFRLGAQVLRGDGWRVVFTRASTIGIVASLGVGTSALLLVPFVEYVLGASHIHGADSGWGLIHFPLKALVTLVLPYVQGPPLNSSIRPLYYSGIIVVSLGTVELLSRRSQRYSICWFFFAAAGLSLAKSYGVGVNWIGAWPLFNIMNFPKHLGVVVCFSLAVLAGLGIDAVAGAKVSMPRAILATVIVPVGFTVLLLSHPEWIGKTPSSGYAIRAAAIAALLVIALQLSFLFLSRGGRGAQAVAGCCAGLMLLELLYLAPKPNRPYRNPSNKPPPAVTFVQKDLGQYRIFGLDGVLYPNTAGYFNLNDIRALDALYPSRYMRYIREFVNPSVYDRFTGGLSSQTPVPESPTHCLRNRWFDLLGVKYIFTPGSKPLSGCEDDRSFISEILARTGTSPALRAVRFQINGSEKSVLLQHPPSEIRFPLRPDTRSRILSFSVALDPRVWGPNKGDGVSFEVSVLVGGWRVLAFSRWVDPKNNPLDRRWIDGSVDLTSYLYREIELVLSTKPGANSMWDWAGWGDLRLGRKREELNATPQYVVVWGGKDLNDKDLRVHQNVRAFPRAFMVYSITSAADGEAAIRRMKEEGLDPARTVVLEVSPHDRTAWLRSEGPPGEMVPVEFLSYEDSRVTLKAVTPRPGVLVLTDIIYPGWSAFLDGKPVPIYPANYAFRAILVPSGSHFVEFVYRPRSFLLGSAVSAGSVLLLLVFVWFSPRWFSHLRVEQEGAHASPTRGARRDENE